MSESFQAWSAYFELNADHLLSIDWEGEGPLRLEEIDWIFTSIRQFQRAFQTDGRQLLNGAHQYFEGKDADTYLTALGHYISEKRRHASLLERFMVQKRIPKLSIHWLDTLFRGTRRTVGYGQGMAILGVAEVIAQVYFEALKYATDSRILARVCDQILWDSTQHGHFMGCSLEFVGAENERKKQRLLRYQRRLLRLAQPVLWWLHYEVLKASGFTYKRFRQACQEGLEQLYAFDLEDLQERMIEMAGKEEEEKMVPT